MEKISILMAVYNPNIPFFIEQLTSINNQDYKNIELHVLDDCSNIESMDSTKELLSQYITKIPYTFKRNPANMGSNRTFEELTKVASGDYFAYCDQDDIWEKNKLTCLLEKIKLENAVIAYSDLSIIDDNGNKVSDSFKDVSKRLEHNYGDNLFSFFLRKNSITGCTMLIKAETAKAALPFPPSEVYVHDHWLALFGSSKGKIAYSEKPLVRYRIHSNNQIGAKVLVGINSKKDYLEKRVLMEKLKVDWLIEKDFPDNQQQEIRKYEKFIHTRKSYFTNTNFANMTGMFKQISRDPLLISFEILLGASKPTLTKKLLQAAKK
jgi:glycosyltransferase involved in cell wall biosynthesis